MSRKILAAILFAGLLGNANAALNPGDIALIGWIDNGTPDSFAFVTLADVSAGETIYFTDNGWTGSQFRGASASVGNGSEGLVQWTANATIAAGAVVLSSDTGAPYWTWTGSGATSGTFSNLSLAQAGDQYMPSRRRSTTR
jgi:hypothetical protein